MTLASLFPSEGDALESWQSHVQQRRAASGLDNHLVVERDGTVWGWGTNTAGQVGDGTTIQRLAPVQVPGLSYVVSVAAGQSHSLALTLGGEVWAWGSNTYGQLGKGAISSQLSPVKVTALAGLKIVAVEAGRDHSMALDDLGRLWVWGRNQYGQLGDGTTVDRNLPVQVSLSSGDGIANIAGGAYHTAVVDEYGAVWTWGYNNRGQLGNNSTTNSSIPVNITGFGNARKVSAGIIHTVALLNDGTVWAWGWNGDGELGDGTNVQRLTPVQVSGLSGIQDVTTWERHSLALTGHGTVKGWGRNFNGVFGTWTAQTAIYAPILIKGLSGISSIAAGYRATFGVKRDGEIKACGMYVGDGTSQGRNMVVQVKGFYGASAAAGGAHSLLVNGDGSVSAWGENSWGQLGDGSTAAHASPTPVKTSSSVFLSGIAAAAAGGERSVSVKQDGTVWEWGQIDVMQNEAPNIQEPLLFATQVKDSSQVPLTEIVAVSSGPTHRVALTQSGGVFAWGANGRGQLGDGSGVDSTLPLPVSSSYGPMVAVSAGGEHTVALNWDTTVSAWGAGNLGQLGNGYTQDFYYPTLVYGPNAQPLSGIVAVAAGRDHCMALKEDGTVWVWGSNAAGQLGDGTTTDRTTAIQVAGLDPVRAIAAGPTCCVVIQAGGQALAWGELGDASAGGMYINSKTPVEVSALYHAIAVEIGGRHCLSLDESGVLRALGSNSNGQLGREVPAYTAHPVQVSTVGDVAQVFVGKEHAGVADQFGDVFVWGSNVYGQHGNGSTVAYDGRNQVRESSGVALAGIIDAAAGAYHNLAVKLNQTVWAWGANEHGQLGDQTTTQSEKAVQVQVSTGGTLSGVVRVSGGSSHSLAVKQDGTVWAWGNNASGQLGDGGTTQQTRAVQVKDGYGNALSGMQVVAAGSSHSLALKNDGTVWAWGENENGQLGDNTTADRTGAVQVRDAYGVALVDIVAISAGESHSLALKNDGTVWAWGANDKGQLGDNTTAGKTGAVQVKDAYGVALSGVQAIAAGDFHGLALLQNGTVLAWGNNETGQLGDGTTIQRTGAVQVKYSSASNGVALGGVTAVYGGTGYSFALKTDGTIASWGTSAQGQLGVGLKPWAALGAGMQWWEAQARPVPGIGLFNEPPTVQIAFSLQQNSTTGDLAVNMQDDENSVWRVEIFNEGVKIYEQVLGPEDPDEIDLKTWGEFHLTAIAYDMHDIPSMISTPITVYVPKP